MPVSKYKQLFDKQMMKDMSKIIEEDNSVSISEIALKMGLSTLTVKNKLKANGYKQVWKKDNE